MQHLETLDYPTWQAALAAQPQDSSLQALEQGQVLYCPTLEFELDLREKQLIESNITSPTAKNISFNTHTNALRGHNCTESEQKSALHGLMQRYCESTKALVLHLLPHYSKALTQGRTSLRVVEAKGRQSSPKKDDTRLHVDAFPSTPMGDMRILRVFSNINPNNQPRVWHLGESFKDVANKFLPTIKKPLPCSRSLLKLFRITKQKRTLYDHYMLNIHDNMKLDRNYQDTVTKTEMAFPAGSTWAVFTDVTSHAALAGQHLLEQTFYLPFEAMQNPQLAPQSMLTNMLNTTALTAL